VRRFLRLVTEVPREFLRDNGFQWSAALSYSTLLALVPVGILAFSLIDLFEEFFNLDQKVVDLLLANGLPEAAEKAGEQVRAVIDRGRAASGSLGVVGTVLLIVVGVSFFTQLEKAANNVWKVKQRRNPFQRFLAFWFVLTLGPILFGISIWASAKLRSPTLLEGAAALGPIVRVFLLAAPLCFTWLTLYVFYMFLPNTRVRTPSALVAAVVAGTLWEGAKWGFNFYVAHAVQMDKVYGPLSILPLFVLWIYVTWVIVLCGAELSYVVQNRRALVARLRGSTGHEGAPREFQALRLMAYVAERFRAGQRPPDVLDLAHHLFLRPEETRELLGHLEREGLVRRDRGGYCLPAREASGIELSRVVAAVRGGIGHLVEDEAEPHARLLIGTFERAERERAAQLGSLTLADVIAAGEPPEPEPREGGDDAGGADRGEPDGSDGLL